MRRNAVSAGTLAVALALLFVGCTGTSERAGQPPASIVGPVWVVEEIAGTPVARDTHITLQLGADGRAFGSGGCNNYNGPYTLSGNALSFGLMAATRMACAQVAMDQEQRYFD